MKRLALLALLACTSTPDAGELGTMRYVGRVKGEPPLRLVPPIVDLSGNVYTAYGSTDFPEVQAIVSTYGGGESVPCTLTRGDTTGFHAWVGYATSQAWYWSGDLLVEVRGDVGQCAPVLDVSPTTNATLKFVGVLPWVYDAPSRTSLVAFVATQDDPTPSIVRVGLREHTFTSVRDFDPPGATNVKVLGVGADIDRQVGMVVVQFDAGGASSTELRTYDAETDLLSSARIDLPPLPAYSIPGTMARSKAGVIGGILPDGRILLGDESSAKAVVAPFEAKGVHRWGDDLWVVGVKDNRPAVAHVDDGGRIEGPLVWSSSEATNGSIAQLHDIRDDRSPPARVVTWDRARNASGPFPFVTPWSLTVHAPDTTLVSVAGPSYDGPAGKVTSIAVGAVGVSYP